MTLILIFIIVFLLLSIVFGSILDDFGAGSAVAFVAAICSFVILEFIGMVINTHETPVHVTTKIVSLQDGSQINGHISGGLFVVSGYIDEAQWFSYYKDNGDGSYSLEKQLADHSSIIPDATPQTARLEADTTITHCYKKWWSLMCQPPSGVYNHGDFHVPPNSITNSFVLDAK